MADAQITAALTRSFHEADKDNSGHLDAQEVEDALRRFSASPEGGEKISEANVAQEAQSLFEGHSKCHKVSQQEFVDHFASRLK